MVLSGLVFARCQKDSQDDFDSEYMSQLLLLGKVEYGGGPIFKVALEC